MGVRPSDRFTVPLCRECHSLQHSMGEGTFWRTVDALDLAYKLWTISGDVEDGERVVFGFRQRFDLRGYTK